MSQAGQPEEHFGPLLGQTARAWRAELDRHMAELGLTDARGFALLQLWRAEGPVEQKTLARLTGVRGPTLVRVIDWLEEAALVQRVACSDDRRAKRLVLTPRGKALAVRIEETARRVREEIFRDLPEEQVEQSLRLLEILRERLEGLRTGDAR